MSIHVDVPVITVRFAMMLRFASAKMPEDDIKTPLIGAGPQAGKALFYTKVSYGKYIN